MSRIWIIIFLTIVGKSLAVQKNFRNEKFLHTGRITSDNQARQLAQLTNVTHMEELLDNICVVRVVGTPGHTTVKNYIIQKMNDLGWTVETDKFVDQTPRGPMEFENIVTKLNPHARRYLALACHYDSKYSREGNFVGATDSAVPCSQLINLATVMKKYLEPLKNANVSLMLIFFDGEEAFQIWGPNDSIYGAKHLAKQWEDVKRVYDEQSDISDLDRIDLLMLLDLLGAPDPVFYSYFTDSLPWYKELIRAEKQLAKLLLFENYTPLEDDQIYFQSYSVRSYVEDDHLPFLHRNVPILHLIPREFPAVWHKSEDNRKNIDLKTTENLNKILRVFIAEYFSLDV